jgi:hypothetical protein
LEGGQDEVIPKCQHDDGHAQNAAADGPRPIGLGLARLNATRPGSDNPASLELAVYFVSRLPA